MVNIDYLFAVPEPLAGVAVIKYGALQAVREVPSLGAHPLLVAVPVLFRGGWTVIADLLDIPAMLSHELGSDQLPIHTSERIEARQLSPLSQAPDGYP